MITITAPTSTIGRQVVQRLLDDGHGLRLVTRDASRLAEEVRDRVEVVEGSHGDAAVVERAFEGARTVFWLPPVDPDAQTVRASFADFARPACAAFSRLGVERVVGISALGRGTAQAEDAGPVTASLELDDLIAASGVAHRAVVNPSFMDNLLEQVDAIRDEHAFAATVDPQLRAPTVATRDIAATAAALLADDAWTGTGEVACLGPEDLTPLEQAEIVSDVLGFEVAYRRVPGQAFLDRMAGFGVADAVARGYLDMFEAKDRGMDAERARTAENTTPTTFRRWCEDVLAPAVRA